ncbi:MAG: cyclic nucleotide-binding domain-containing protein [Planctomycetota bacterium]
MSSPPEIPPPDESAGAGGVARDVDALAKLSVFGALTRETIAFLARRCQDVVTPKNGTFCHQGDAGDCLFVLRQGRVAVIRTVGKKSVVLAELAAGECFGEMALLAISARNATVRALEDCVALRLRHHALLELSQQDLEQFALLQMNLARDVARRLAAADQALLDHLGR